MSASGKFLLDRGWEPEVELTATAGKRTTWAKYWRKAGLRLTHQRALAYENRVAALDNEEFLLRWDQDVPLS